MHKKLVDEVVKNVRQRIREGDNPTVEAFSVEMLECCVDALAEHEAKKSSVVWGRNKSIAENIINIMGEYLGGSILLVQENAVRYAVNAVLSQFVPEVVSVKKFYKIADEMTTDDILLHYPNGVKIVEGE